VQATDRLFDDARALRSAEAALLGALSVHGFDEVIVPLVEDADVYVSGADLRLVDGGRVLGLRADFTGPVARIVSTRLPDPSVPLRLSYRGVLFRGGRQRWQAGGEIFGVPGPEGDAAAIRAGLAALDAAGVSGVRVVLGSAGDLEAVHPGALADSELRAALDRRDAHALESAPDLARMLLERPLTDRLSRVLAHLGPDEARVVVDPAHVRGFPYYSGVVFDFFAPGYPGPLGGGGRYDGLCARYGAPRPAVGFSLDVERIAAGPREVGRPLTIGLPKGRLSAPVLDALGELAPTPGALDTRALVVPGRTGELRFLLLKPADVPAYVERGAADLGIAGLDVLRESPADVLEPLVTALGVCNLCLCGLPGSDLPARVRAGSLRVATKYPAMARKALASRGLVAEIIPLHGSVELAVVADLADAIVDIVETGATLRANGLVVVEALAASSARVVVNRAAWALRESQLAPILARLEAACGS
jgi:ATP phosphoribosyltransferase regulatory subunit